MVHAKTALPVKLHIRFRRIRSRRPPRRRASCSNWSISVRGWRLLWIASTGCPPQPDGTEVRHTSIGARRLVPATVVETYHYPAS